MRKYLHVSFCLQWLPIVLHARTYQVLPPCLRPLPTLPLAPWLCVCPSNMPTSFALGLSSVWNTLPLHSKGIHCICAYIKKCLLPFHVTSPTLASRLFSPFPGLGLGVISPASRFLRIELNLNLNWNRPPAFLCLQLADSRSWILSLTV